jgi:hypothetical protein
MSGEMAMSAECGSKDAPDLGALCRESGWRFVARGSGLVLVDLELADRFEQARVTSRGREVEFVCELVATGRLSAESREAIMHCLGVISETFRPGRAWIPPGGPQETARLEVVLEAPMTPSDFSSALESLSAGCSLCGEELKSLQTPAVATRYLDLQGSRVPTATSPHTRNTP